MNNLIASGTGCAALLAILVCIGSTSFASPEAQRFAAAKAQRRQVELETYLITSQRKVDQAWQHWTSAAHGKLLITKVKMKVAADGNFDASISAGSGSVVEDQVVLDCLKSVSLRQLPSGIENLEIYLTLMSDGSLNMAEFTDSAEANDYNLKVIGAKVLPPGICGNTAPYALTPVAGNGATLVIAGSTSPTPGSDAAIARWEEAVRQNPLSPDNHIGLGQAFHNHGDFAQAKQEYLQAIRLSPGKQNATAQAFLDGLQNPTASTPPEVAHGQQDVDYGPYMADLQRRIKRAWFPPKGNESKRVVVVFRIHRDGSMSDLRLDHSSGVDVADEAGLEALRKAAPFRPLPPGSKDSVDLQFTFDYNVFNGGGLGKFTRF